MSQSIAIARETLLDAPGLSESHLEKVMERLLSRQVDAADIFFQYAKLESWVLEDGIIKEGTHSIEQGAGLRAISGDKTGFAYTDSLQPSRLLEAAGAARAIAQAGKYGAQAIAGGNAPKALYAPTNPLDSLSEEQKIDLMRRADAAARAADPRVQQVIVSLVAAHDVILVMDNSGQISGDVRPLVRMNVQVIVEQDGRREQGSAGGGARQALDFFLVDDRATGYAREAVRQALVNLDAVAAPAGMLPVVLGSGWAGVLLHEAVGHGLEGDFNRKGTSAFTGRIGEQVASTLCTVVDDGTLPGRRGSLTINDEGTPSGNNVLIENGILVRGLGGAVSQERSGLPGVANSRAQNWNRPPIDRMANLNVEPGDKSVEDMISSVEHGVYMETNRSWSIDDSRNKFQFGCEYGKLIENGKLTKTVRNPNYRAISNPIWNSLAMIGNKDTFEMYGTPYCRKG